MEVRIRHLGEVTFEAGTRGHRVICDQPANQGGGDTGMTPPEFLLAALGTCSGYYAAQYLKNHSLPADGLEVVVSAEKLKSPARMGNFRVDVIVPGIGAVDETGIRRTVEACLIHQTLTHSPIVEIAVNALAQPA